MSATGSLAVALSGGVDSAVTAWLLSREQPGLPAIYMNNWEMDDDGSCPGEIDARDAAAVAAHLEALDTLDSRLAQAYCADSLRTAQRARAPRGVFDVLTDWSRSGGSHE